MARQQTLEGMEHPHGDKQLDELLAARRKTSKQRKKFSDLEVSHGEAIAERMREKGFKVYVSHDHSPPLIAKLTDATKLKIDEFDDSPADDGDDDIEEADASEQKASKKKLAAVES